MASVTTVLVADWANATKNGDSIVTGNVNNFDDPNWTPLNGNPGDNVTARDLNAGVDSESTITTWEHSPEPGAMLLLDYDLHAGIGHTGGRQLWGNGTQSNLPDWTRFDE